MILWNERRSSHWAGYHIGAPYFSNEFNENSKRGQGHEEVKNMIGFGRWELLDLLGALKGSEDGNS
jgi:hypothetical protein